MENQRLVTEFEKNDREMLKVQIQTFRGQEYVDVRAWIKDEASGEYRATPKGLTIHVELLPELIAALEKAALVLDGARH
jgi:hypothetical protein